MGWGWMPPPQGPTGQDETLSFSAQGAIPRLPSQGVSSPQSGLPDSADGGPAASTPSRRHCPHPAVPQGDLSLLGLPEQRAPIPETRVRSPGVGSLAPAKASPWLVVAAFSLGPALSFLCMSVPISSREDASCGGSGPTLVTPFYLSHLFKDPVSSSHVLRSLCLGFNMDLGGQASPLQPHS